MRYYVNMPLPPNLKSRVKVITRAWQANVSDDPHITLLPPQTLLPSKTEADLIGALEAVSERVPTFPVQVIGHGFFGEKSVIYARIEPSENLGHCHMILRRVTQGILQPEGRTVDFNQLHVTLAKGLTPGAGAALWQQVSAEVWDYSFVCGSINLMRRAEGDDRWHWLQGFRLSWRDR